MSRKKRHFVTNPNTGKECQLGESFYLGDIRDDTPMTGFEAKLHMAACYVIGARQKQLRILEEAKAIAQAAGGADKPEVKPAPITKQPGLDARAMGLFIANPSWTKTRIASELGCNEKSLSPKRCPKLDSAMRLYRAREREVLGTKDKDGNLEAWTEG